MRIRELDKRSFKDGVSSWVYFKPNGAFCKSSLYTSDWVNGSVIHMVDTGSRRTDELCTRYLEYSRTEIESFPIDIENTFDSTDCGGVAKYRVTGRLGPQYSIQGSPWYIDQDAIHVALIEALRYFESGCAPKETLLANFAWELPQVKALWPTFRDFFRNRGKRRSTLSEIRDDLKDYSNGFLAYNFGIVPLVGDLITVWNRLSGLNDHISWLRKNSGSKVKVEFRTSLPKPTASTLPSLPSNAPGGSGGFWRSVPELRTGLKAWALLTYDVSALTDLQLKTRSLMRSFGLNNPAAIVWEAIPYSFVVDWISNVGQLLDLLEKPIKLPVVFHDSGYGVFCESVIVDHFTTWGKSAVIRKTKVRGYSRRQGIPISISGLSLDTPSAKQLVLGLALLGQKF